MVTIDPQVVEFKSVPVFFDKELSGIKPNTLRKIDPADDRFTRLRNGTARFIRIRRSDSPCNSFLKAITDYSEYEGWAIISWKA